MRTLLAVNGALGLVVEYNVIDGLPQLLRTKSLFDRQAVAGALTQTILGNDARAEETTSPMTSASL